MPSEFMISTVRGLRSDSPGDSSLWARLAHRVALSRASQTFDVIKPHLKGKVLDIGVGAGSLLHLIRKNGFEVEGVDVVDKSMYEEPRGVQSCLLSNGPFLFFFCRRCLLLQDCQLLFRPM